MTSSLVVRDVTQLIVELGILDADAVERKLGAEELAEPLYQPRWMGLLALLDRLGIAYTVSDETFYAPRTEIFAEQLEKVAAGTRGLLTCTDVELVRAPDADLLRFRCNGSPREWNVGYGSRRDDDEYWLTGHLRFTWMLATLLPEYSRARWCSVHQPEPEYGGYFVLADPEPLQRLGDRFGLTFYELSP